MKYSYHFYFGRIYHVTLRRRVWIEIYTKDGRKIKRGKRSLSAGECGLKSIKPDNGRKRVIFLTAM